MGRGATRVRRRPQWVSTMVAPLTFMALTACSGPSATPFNPALPHHRGDGTFINVLEPDPDHGPGDLLRWRWEAIGKAVPGADAYAFPVARAAAATLADTRPGSFTVTWIGHATVLVRMGGLNILTDPQFSERASPVSWMGPRRVVPPVPGLDQLPPIHAVVISHDHYDSLDVNTVRRLRARPGGANTVFFTPLGYRKWFAELGVTNVVERDWWESSELGGVTFTAVPVRHWCKRTPWDHNRRLWSGWAMAGAGKKVLFAGDSGYTRHFAEIGQRLGPFDLALIPIGAYEPRWFMAPYHMNPEEAVRVHQDVRAVRSVAIHWGTFILTDEPLTEPPVELAAALLAADIRPSAFKVLMHGQTLRLGGAPSPPVADATPGAAHGGVPEGTSTVTPTVTPEATPPPPVRHGRGSGV